MFSSEINESADSCRLCLRKFTDGETSFRINSELRQKFLEMTQNELHTSDLLSQLVCESCLELIDNFVAWKLQFIENQKILESDLIYTESIVDESGILSNCHFSDQSIKIQEEHLEAESEPELASHESPENTKQPLIALTRKYMKLCTDCGKTYSSQAYKRHFERVHLKLKNYYCDFCPYSSYTRSHMEIHLLSHLKIKNHHCGQCGKSFGSSNILKQHFLKHKDERPFTCNEDNCSLAFKSVYALRRHKKTHSLDRRKFSCDVCTASFADSWHLRRHQKSHTTQTLSCQHCSKTFGTDERLRAHQVYHQTPKYRCEDCQKDFFKRHSLETHRKTHTGQRDFNCSLCPSQYFKQAHLRRHLKSHLKSENFEESGK